MLQSIDIATFFNPSNEFLQFECFEIHVCRISPYNIINLDFSMLSKLLLFQESNIAFYYTTRVLSFQAIKSGYSNRRTIVLIVRLFFALVGIACAVIVTQLVARFVVTIAAARPCLRSAYLYIRSIAGDMLRMVSNVVYSSLVISRLNTRSSKSSSYTRSLQ